MCDIKKQWEQDVSNYGDNAFLLWEFVADNGKYTESLDNSGISKFFGKTEEYCRFLRRKESAALTFDIERSKAGDVVEICAMQGWVNCNSKTFEKRKYPLIQLDGISVSVHNLQMKYPPKEANK